MHVIFFKKVSIICYLLVYLSGEIFSFVSFCNDRFIHKIMQQYQGPVSIDDNIFILFIGCAPNVRLLFASIFSRRLLPIFVSWRIARAEDSYAADARPERDEEAQGPDRNPQNQRLSPKAYTRPGMPIHLFLMQVHKII